MYFGHFIFPPISMKDRHGQRTYSMWLLNQSIIVLADIFNCFVLICGNEI